MSLNLIDALVMTLYWAGLIGLGFFSLKKAANLREHFLAGGTATWPMVGLALFASTVSATTLVGVTGSAYANGISVYNYEWPAAIILVLFCALVLPQIVRSQIFTLPEFLEMRFGRFARTYVSGLSIFLGIFVDSAGGLFAGAVLFQILIPQMAFWQVCALLSVMAGGFLVLGGLRVVILTETVQGIVMIICCTMIAYLTFKATGGWNETLTRLEPSSLKLILPAHSDIMPWLGLVTGVPLIGFYFWCTNQSMVQRVLAAKSLDHGRWGSLFAGGLKLLNLFIIVLPGSAALLLFPHLDRPDQVFSHLIFKVLPHGFIGLILGACVVSLLSGVASNYNAVSTLISIDFIKRFWPNISDKHLITLGKLIVVFLMILSALWAPQVVTFKDTLWQYIQAILSYFVSPIATLFMAGLYWQRANARGAALGLMLGTLCSVFLFVGIEIIHAIDLHFLVASGVIFLFSAIGVVIGSLSAPAPDADTLKPLVFSRELWKIETQALKLVPFYKNYRLISVALVILTTVIVWRFA